MKIPIFTMNFSFRVQVPDIFQKLSKDICEADANAVDLGRMNKNFYEFGRYMARFDNIGHVGPMLVEVKRPSFQLIEN